MILFVASNPSKLNHDPNIAIIGSKSEKTFNSWVQYLAPNSEYSVVNVSDKITDKRPLRKSEFDLKKLYNHVSNPLVTKIIAMGNIASCALEEIGVEFYKIPHPSPLNRFLNNKVQVKAVLKECKKWLNK